MHTPEKQAKLLVAIAAMACVILVSGASVTHAADAPKIDPAHLKFFETKVRPLLAERCYKCHGEDKQKGDLRMDSLAGLMHGGKSGPAIEPGQPDKSLIITAINYADIDLEMPPKKQLPAEEITTLTEWVKLGAPWPGADAAKLRDGDKFTDEDRAYWFFQPLAKPAPPKVNDGGWASNAIDRFVYQRLAAEGLKPAPLADRRTIIRRVYFDLIGLPPAPGDVEAFVADPDPNAYEKLVDRLLASPQYGEKWARHWMDLVRYADSDGYKADHYRSTAWRYRDYVIESFNADKPYNQFMREQLAGDEIDPTDPQMLVAISYTRHGIYEFNQRDARFQRDAMLQDVTDVTADVFMGLGYGCANANLLRLWRSEAPASFDFASFNTGDYYGAVRAKIDAETHVRREPFLAEIEAQWGPAPGRQQTDGHGDQQRDDGDVKRAPQQWQQTKLARRGADRREPRIPRRAEKEIDWRDVGEEPDRLEQHRQHDANRREDRHRRRRHQQPLHHLLDNVARTFLRRDTAERNETANQRRRDGADPQRHVQRAPHQQHRNRRRDEIRLDRAAKDQPALAEHFLRRSRIGLHGRTHVGRQPRKPGGQGPDGRHGEIQRVAAARDVCGEFGHGRRRLHAG